jgi:hypothetical protein
MKNGKRWTKVMDSNGRELSGFNQDTGMSDGICGMYRPGAEVIGEAHREAACTAKTYGTFT